MPVELAHENSPAREDASAVQREPKSSRGRRASRPSGTAIGNKIPLRLLVLATLCVAVVWFWTNSDLRFESVASALRGVSSVSLIVALCFVALQVFFQTARFAIL